MQGKYADAELLCEQARVIREKALGPEHPDVARSLNNRAELLVAKVRTVRVFQDLSQGSHLYGSIHCGRLPYNAPHCLLCRANMLRPRNYLSCRK